MSNENKSTKDCQFISHGRIMAPMSNNTSKFVTKGNAIRFRSNGRRVGFVQTIKRPQIPTYFSGALGRMVTVPGK